MANNFLKELTAVKATYLTFHPERDEKENEESLANLLKRLKTAEEKNERK